MLRFLDSEHSALRGTQGIRGAVQARTRDPPAGSDQRIGCTTGWACSLSASEHTRSMFPGGGLSKRSLCAAGELVKEPVATIEDRNEPVNELEGG